MIMMIIIIINNILLKLFTATAIYNKPEWPGITLSIKYWHKK